ncbi:MAG: hypothetical protein WEA31_00925 [Pirellulales bacterium]
MTMVDLDSVMNEFERDVDSRFQRPDPNEWKYRRRPKYCRKVKIQRKNAPSASSLRYAR